MMQRKINLAFIGGGYWGPNLIRNFSSIPECVVRSICDKKEDRLSHLKRLYPDSLFFNDESEIFNDPLIDAVIIATPVGSHFTLGKLALEAKKHVFIEKPMTLSSESSLELFILSEREDRVLMTGHTFIYSPVVLKIKEIIDSGELGKVLYVSSQRLNLGLFQKDVNVAWDLAPHDLSILLYLLEDLPYNVSCHGSYSLFNKRESVTNMTINFFNGTFVIIQSSWLDPNKVRKMTFVGDKKMLVYDDLEAVEKIKIFDKKVSVPPHYDTFGEFQFSYHYGDIYSPYIKQQEPLKIECQHFLDCINSGEKSRSGGREGYAVVKILEAASESLRNEGVFVDVSLDLSIFGD